MARLRYNGLVTALGASLTNVATSATLAAALTYSDGTAVPTIGGGDYLPLTLLNPDGTFAELVYVTDYTTGTTTITAMLRGAEGSTAQAHANGAVIHHAPTPLDMPQDPIYVPLPGQRVVDEFNDGTVDSAWLDCDPAGAPSSARTYTEAGDAMSVFLNAGDSSGSMRGRVRPMSAFGGAMATGDAFITRLSEFPLSNTQLSGLVLSTAGTVTGNQLCASIYNSSSLLNFGYTTLTSWASGSLSVVGSFGISTPSVWIRLVFLGSNTWRMDLGIDGISWVKGSTVSWAFTPTHVGLGTSVWGLTSTVKCTATYDTLRRVSGVT